jgi:hypothetical protein
VMFCTVQLESVNISGSGVSDADVCVCVWNVYWLFTVFEVCGNGKVVKINLVF